MNQLNQMASETSPVLEPLNLEADARRFLGKTLRDACKVFGLQQPTPHSLKPEWGCELTVGIDLRRQHQVIHVTEAVTGRTYEIGSLDYNYETLCKTAVAKAIACAFGASLFPEPYEEEDDDAYAYAR